MQTKAVTTQAQKMVYLYDKQYDDIEPFYSSVQNDTSADMMDKVQVSETDNKL